MSIVKRLQWLQRFRVATLLVLMIPIGIGLLFARERWLNRPIAWEKFSESKKDAYLRDGKIVVVVLTADWNMSSHHQYREFEGSPECRRWVHEHDAAPLLADWSEDDPAIRAWMDELDIQSLCIVIYSPNAPDAPLIVHPADNIRPALEKAAAL